MDLLVEYAKEISDPENKKVLHKFQGDLGNEIININEVFIF